MPVPASCVAMMDTSTSNCLRLTGAMAAAVRTALTACLAGLTNEGWSQIAANWRAAALIVLREFSNSCRREPDRLAHIEEKMNRLKLQTLLMASESCGCSF